MSTYLTISSLLNFLAATIQVFIFISSRDRSMVRMTYLRFLTLIAIWSGTYYLWQLSEDATTAEFYCKLLISAAAFEPVAYLHFGLALSGIKMPKTVFTGYLIATLFVCMVPFGWIVDGVSARMGHAFWPNAGIMMPAYLLFFNAYLAISVYVLYQGWSKNIGGKASDCLLVLFSGLIGFIGGGTNFPLWYDIPIQPYGNILVSIYLFLLVHGLYHNRIFGLSLDFYKVLIGLTLNGSVTLFYLLFMTLYGNTQGKQFSPEEYLIQGMTVLGISVFLFWGVPRLKSWSERILDGVFRRQQASSLRLLSELPIHISELADENEIHQLVTDTIQDCLEITGVSYFHLEPFESRFRCVAKSGDFPKKIDQYTLDTDHPLIESLGLRPECLVLSQMYNEMDPHYYEALVALKNDLDINVVIPIFGNRRIYGLILIRQLDKSRSWSAEEISTLFNIGTQIGLNTRVRDLERSSNEEKKLVALGTMAAGLAHEIRNPLVSVQTLAQMLQKGKRLEEVSDEFKDVILRDVKRIGGIVEGVARYSLNQQGKQSIVSINEVIQSSLNIYQNSEPFQSIQIKVDADFSGAIHVRANFDQLEQVFNNLLENASHALAKTASPLIQIQINKREVRSNGGYSWVEIAVSDNGSGIPDSIKDRVFDPFITSKDTGDRGEKKGMGLGLAISKRIVENHQGALVVQNSSLGGAKFVVSLKIHDHAV